MFKHAALAAAFTLGAASPAFAWGSTGHRLISHAAAQSFPATLPAFLRTPQALREITELGPELDRLKGSGQPHDADEDPGHYLDANDDLSIAGSLGIATLPASREAYDTALRAAGMDQYKAGWLPYSIIDGWEALRKDSAYWRADAYLEKHAATPADRAWFAKDRALREVLTLRDLGVWGHYVGDGSQPLHVTNHFNGWGNYPNPKNYSTSHEVHSDFESDYVNKHATQAAVDALVQAKPVASFIPADGNYRVQTQAGIEQIEGYLSGSAQAVIPLYDLDLKAPWETANDAEHTNFVHAQLARGAVEMRDLVVAAWQSSLTQQVAYPPISVQDILRGKSIPSARTFGSD